MYAGWQQLNKQAWVQARQVGKQQAAATDTPSACVIGTCPLLFVVGDQTEVDLMIARPGAHGNRYQTKTPQSLTRTCS